MEGHDAWWCYSHSVVFSTDRCWGMMMLDKTQRSRRHFLGRWDCLKERRWSQLSFVRWSQLIRNIWYSSLYCSSSNIMVWGLDLKMYFNSYQPTKLCVGWIYQQYTNRQDDVICSPECHQMSSIKMWPAINASGEYSGPTYYWLT